MVTAELAAALPVLAVVMITAVWGIGLASAQLGCADAAREAARAAARGESMTTVREIATEVAPQEADVVIDESEGLIEIEVRATVAAPPPIGSTLEPAVRGRAVAIKERP
ncbi:TadE family type IV pilus minor pilin [Phytoactinopolyspora halophila]|uniref:Pilus assembly protein TadE n=1 Tax=Phytoactinopolyspora halophila TaxID=1981511 RepID=A0A329R1I6_9ACTN|nr:TadE family type IV pilus minor pilin [Phytoactinopolyspora halophila]RAW17819.1 hypothetical protein DPM12_02885 [Phytoactinopolyspora halophila]